MILEGIVTTLSPDGTAEHRADGPAGRRPTMRPVRAPAVPDLDDLPQPQGAAARASSTSPTTSCCSPRRRSAPVDAADPAGRRRRGPDPRSTPAATTSSASSSSTTATSGRRSRSRPWPRAGCATSSASTAPSTPSSRRRSWRPGPTFLPLDEILADFRKLAVLVDKTGGAAEHAAFDLLDRSCPRRRPPARPRPGRPPTPMTRTSHPDPEPAPFGLLGWGPQAPRQFGGVGLMIDAPGLELTAEPAAELAGRGPAGRSRPRRSPTLSPAARRAGDPRPAGPVPDPSAPRPSTSAWASGPSSSLAVARRPR